MSQPQDARVNIALSNSFGFGGVNAALLFREVDLSRIFVSGMGAVSPAGWNVAALRLALEQGTPLPIQPLRGRAGRNRSGRDWFPASSPSGFPRSSARATRQSHHTLRRVCRPGSRGPLAGGSGRRPPMGVIVCLQSGCIQYSCRFLTRR